MARDKGIVASLASVKLISFVPIILAQSQWKVREGSKHKVSINSIHAVQRNSWGRLHFEPAAEMERIRGGFYTREPGPWEVHKQWLIVLSNQLYGKSLRFFSLGCMLELSRRLVEFVRQRHWSLSWQLQGCSAILVLCLSIDPSSKADQISSLRLTLRLGNLMISKQIEERCNTNVT